MSSIASLLVRIGAETGGLTAPLSEASTSLNKWANGVSSTLGSIAVGLPFAAIGATAFKMAESMQSAQFTIRRATGATGEALADLEKSFQNVYRNTARSSEDVSAALSKLNVETKLTGRALEELTSYNLKFAKVTGTDVKAAIEGSQDVFKQWGIEGRDQIAAMDSLYKVTQLTGMGIEKLMGAVSGTGPALRSFGFSFQEAAVLIGNMEEKGVNASNLIGALNRGMVELAASGKDPKQTLIDLAAQMKNAATSADAVNIATDIFGKRGAIALQDAARRGAFDMADLNKQLKENVDTVGKAADETVKFSDKIKKLGHELEITGSRFAPMIMALGVAVPLLTSLGKSLMSVAAAASAGVFGVLAVGFGTVTAAIWATVSAYDALMEKWNDWAKKNQKGGSAKVFVLPEDQWTKGMGEAVSKGLPVSVAKPDTKGAGGAGTGEEKFKPATIPQMVEMELASRATAAISKLVSIISDEKARVDALRDAFFRAYDAGDPSALIRAYDVYGQKLAYVSSEVVMGFAEWYRFTEAARAAIDELQNIDRATAGIEGMKAAIASAIGPFVALQDAVKKLGITTQDDLDKATQNAADTLERMRQSGLYTYQDLLKAELAWLKAKELSVGLTKEQIERIKELNAQVGKTSSVLDKPIKKTTEMSRQISTVMTDLSRSLTDLMFKGGKLSDIFVDIGKAIVRSAIEAQFKRIGDLIGGLISQSGALSKVWGVIFGGGGQAAGGVANAAGGAASAAGGAVSTAGSAAGSAGKAASSGIMGTVGAIGSVASAVSSIIGNFQMSGMNKSLDLIVKHTLQTANQLIYGVQWSLNTYLPALSGIHERLIAATTTGMPIYNAAGDGGLRLAGAGGGGAGVSMTVSGNYFLGTSGLDQFLDEVVRRLKERGVK